MITSRDISVIVQGPVAPGGPDTPYSTAAALASVRRILPKAEIILSTWPGQNLAGLAPDVLVQPPDPGPQVMDATGKIARKNNNVNRQIVSTVAGLRAATRPWAVKLRSDTSLVNDGFLRHLDENAAREPRWQVFSERIVTINLGCLNPRLVPGLFHVSDLFHAGRRDDLLRLWDNPPAPEPETSQWLVGKPRPWVVWAPEGFFARYVPEQYIWISCLQRHGHAIQLQHPGDAPLRLAWISERLFLNNFRPVSVNELGLRFPPHLESGQKVGIHYTEETWSHLIATTVARRPSLRYRLEFGAATLFCRGRCIWRNYAGSHPHSLLVRLVRRARPIPKP